MKAMSSPGFSDTHPIFKLNHNELFIFESEMIRGLTMFSREAAALNPNTEHPIEFRRVGGKVGVFVAPLIAASLECGDMDSGD